VRRLLVVLVVAVFSLPVVAGAQSSLFTKPTVIVYPFSANTSTVDREASSRLATIIATGMANSGKVFVTPPPPGTERKDFLSVARANHADYYISGFISPLGNGVSVVEQVVSTVSGIVVYSQSAQLATYDDAAGQGDDLANLVTRHANRGLAGIGTPPPQASPTAAPSSGPEANLGKLFKRRPKATPTPKPTVKPSGVPIASTSVAAPPTSAPRTVAAVPVPPRAATPTPAPPPPPPAAAIAAGQYAVLPVDGTAEGALRELATQRLVARAMGQHAANAAEACATHGLKAVLSGTLAVRPDPQYGGYSASFDLSAHDCAGKLLWRQTHSNDAGGGQAAQVATERAVDGAIGAFLNPPKRRR
jgi:TolB-like protein